MLILKKIIRQVHIKAKSGFCLHVRPSVRMYQRGLHWTDSVKFDIGEPV
jgi:hypothetical protein